MGYDPNNPTTKGRPCPKIGGNPCPGTEDGCTFWRTESVEINSKPRLIQNCLFVLEHEATYQGVAETIKLQAEIHHFNNQVHMTVLALSKGIEPPSLSGNFKKDYKVLEQFGSVPALPEGPEE